MTGPAGPSVEGGGTRGGAGEGVQGGLLRGGAKAPGPPGL